MMKLLWNLVGAKRTVNGLGEIKLSRKQMLSASTGDMLELSCILGLILVMSTALLTVNASTGNVLGDIMTGISLICGAVLLTVLLLS